MPEGNFFFDFARQGSQTVLHTPNELRFLRVAGPELLLEMVGERTPTVRGDVILLSSVGWLTLAGKYGVILVWCQGWWLFI